MEKLLGKNWITTLGGLIAALGGVLALLPKSVNLDPQWGAFVVGLGGAIAGFGSKDFNNHSTQTEVRKATIEENIKEADKALLR